MRLDIVTIFPAYLAPLELSLAGRAQANGLLSVRTHDLRTWTHDLHRSVDDTPYGGGPGMVMRPEPWGEALDALVPDDVSPPRLIVPSPAGRPFSQADAARLAVEPWLLFACGRYEGIDQRVVEHAASRMPVEEISLGDYVLNGGEVAVLAIVEAVSRLLPGFVGNPESLVEESHAATGADPQGGGSDETGGADASRPGQWDTDRASNTLLEYPVYTKPATWRGLDVPTVLLSGHHGKIAAWRREQARRRTRDRRPDLLS